MSFFNDEERNSNLMQFIKKNMELKLSKRILATRYNNLQLKTKVLEEKRKELDNINCSVWDTEDKFCNDVWNFSLEHNFSSFFNRYPEITEINYVHKCRYNSIIDEDSAKTNVYKENMLLQLKHEIDILNNELILIRNDNVETDLQYYKLILDNLKSFSEEISELIRSITTLENSANICNTNQKPNLVEGFITARKIFKKPNFHNRVLTEKKHISFSTTVVTGPKEPCTVRSNVKFGRFIMKKRSLISLKVEQNSMNWD